MREDKELELDWKGLADPNTTLVIYMGISNIPQITTRLITNRLSPKTRAATIGNDTRPNQKLVASTLGEIAKDTAEAQLEGPILFIIGNIIDLLDITGKEQNNTHIQSNHRWDTNVA